MTSFWNFGVCKALVLWKSKKKKKSGLLSNHLFQRKQEHGDWKEPQNNDNYL